MRNRDERGMDGMRQGIQRGFNSATTTCNGENGSGRVHLDRTGASRERNAKAIPIPLSRVDPDASREALERGNSSNGPRITTHVLRSGGTHMGQCRSKLDRHGHELLALRRGGATVAQLTRWLRVERDAAVAATTVARWLARVDTLTLDPALGFDAVAALDALRNRGRELRFPRLAVSQIDEYGYHVLRLRAEGATIGECHRALRDEHGLRVDRSTVSRWLRKHANGQA